MNNTKICSKCLIKKELLDFHKDINNKTGYSVICKECKKQYDTSHQEKRKIRRKKSYLANCEKQKEMAKTWRKNNLAQAKATGKKYLLDNPKKAKNVEAGLLASILHRDTILQRDNYKCQLCGTDRALTMHHIVPKTKDLTLVSDLNNLIILCKLCHKNKAHNGCYRRLDENIAQQLKLIIKNKELTNA